MYPTAVAALMALLLGCSCSAEGSAQRASRAAEGAHQVDAVHAERRAALVDELRRQGIRQEPVLAAIANVPRHRFVPVDLEPLAYANQPLPIGNGQTISQPYIVALMTELLDIEPGDRVLEIGTGSGYQAAVLAELGCRVYTIEIIPELATGATRLLADLGYFDVDVRVGDGYLGWPEEAPFDKIIVTAAPEQMPRALVEQLGAPGRLVAPIGPVFNTQQLVLLEKTSDGELRAEQLLAVRFVPMVKKKQ